MVRRCRRAVVGWEVKKIISLFQRNYDGDKLVKNEIVPGAEWVLSGEGIATRKYDGTCCMVRNQKLYKRYDLKKGRNTPNGFEAAQNPDSITGHTPGWVPVGEGPEDQYFREAFHGDEIDGTYELVGPKIQGNPEKYSKHELVFHALADKVNAPRTFDELKEWFKNQDIEGIVWHHGDGRMVKIKKKDFGYKR